VDYAVEEWAKKILNYRYGQPLTREELIDDDQMYSLKLSSEYGGAFTGSEKIISEKAEYEKLINYLSIENCKLFHYYFAATMCMHFYIFEIMYEVKNINIAFKVYGREPQAITIDYQSLSVDGKLLRLDEFLALYPICRSTIFEIKEKLFASVQASDEYRLPYLLYGHTWQLFESIGAYDLENKECR
jgi:hypothetical protein